MVQRRPLGSTDIEISTVAMGCWPISGMTSLDVNHSDSLKTLRAAVDAGINFFDTAYCYGRQGESERLIAEALGGHRRDIVIATKAGIHWNHEGNRCQDATPDRLRYECETSLKRLGVDHVDLLYIHAPDPRVPVQESAAELNRLMEEGKTRSVGVSNFNVDQLDAFAQVCPITAVQPPYNMLQREIESDIVPWCRKQGASAIIYWPLMKGLLAGKLPRDHVFAPGDGRGKYPMFQGEQWSKNQDFVDDLRQIATTLQITVAQLVIAWTIEQPGISSALCGAKRAHQISETAQAMKVQLTDQARDQIRQALDRRGVPVTQAAV
ncbi:MAG: aldo/keto reductase [Pirellulales bacterium]|nr:aldo/keto reductase [Pirellulales bacterium]